jgi:hypothetical protein
MDDAAHEFGDESSAGALPDRRLFDSCKLEQIVSGDAPIPPGALYSSYNSPSS